MQWLKRIKTVIRLWLRQVARSINKLTGGHLSPNSVTILGLLAHVPIALAIAGGRYTLAAILLIIFGLFDTLDGELARLQKRESSLGMLLDASTDRMKEVLLYAGITYSFVFSGHPYWAVWAVLAVGSSLIVSYVKAKGETAVAKSNLTLPEINYLFQDGLMNFEMRMFLIVIGLLFHWLPAVVVVITITAFLNAISRLVNIARKI